MSGSVMARGFLCANPGSYRNKARSGDQPVCGVIDRLSFCIMRKLSCSSLYFSTFIVLFM